MATITNTVYDASGAVVSTHEVETDDSAPALAAQVNTLSSAVQDLVVQSLGTP